MKLDKSALDENGNVTISEKQYIEYVIAAYKLSWLESTGVDNWQGYEFMYDMPDPDDYDTLDEYETAWQAALSKIW